MTKAFTSGKKVRSRPLFSWNIRAKEFIQPVFITSERADEVEQKTWQKMCVRIFIPTTPIPTGGFLIIVPEEKVIKLDMSVADGFKYIISLGALAQEHASSPEIK